MTPNSRIGLPSPRLEHSRSGAVQGSCGYNEDAILIVALSDTKDDAFLDDISLPIRIIVVVLDDNGW